VLLATAGVLCEEAATEGEKALECGAEELWFEGSCWWFDVWKSYNWAQAEDVCNARQMSLASIHSEMEQAFVHAMTAEGHFCWIGFSDAAKEGRWQWSDGTPVDYLNWDPMQPDGGDSEDCAYTWGIDGEWGDTPCTNRIGVVCRGQSY